MSDISLSEVPKFTESDLEKVLSDKGVKGLSGGFIFCTVDMNNIVDSAVHLLDIFKEHIYFLSWITNSMLIDAINKVYFDGCNLYLSTTANDYSHRYVLVIADDLQGNRVSYMFKFNIGYDSVLCCFNNVKFYDTGDDFIDLSFEYSKDYYASKDLEIKYYDEHCYKNIESSRLKKDKSALSYTGALCNFYYSYREVFNKTEYIKTLVERMRRLIKKYKLNIPSTVNYIDAKLCNLLSGQRVKCGNGKVVEYKFEEHDIWYRITNILENDDVPGECYRYSWWYCDKEESYFIIIFENRDCDLSFNINEEMMHNMLLSKKIYVMGELKQSDYDELKSRLTKFNKIDDSRLLLYDANDNIIDGCKITKSTDTTHNRNSYVKQYEVADDADNTKSGTIEDNKPSDITKEDINKAMSKVIDLMRGSTTDTTYGSDADVKQSEITKDSDNTISNTVEDSKHSDTTKSTRGSRLVDISDM